MAIQGPDFTFFTSQNLQDGLENYPILDFWARSPQTNSINKRDLLENVVPNNGQEAKVRKILNYTKIFT